MIKKYLILFFLLCSLQVFCVENISQVLQKLPSQDRDALTYLFKRLLFQEDFAYCLWGTKPIAIDDGIYKNTDWEMFSKTFKYPKISEDKGESNYYKEGVYAWRKYKHLFKLQKFILLDEEKDLFPKSVAIALINKEEFKKLVNCHLPIFQSVLGKEVTADSLLEKIEEKKESLKKTIAYHEGLLGLLLGYGEQNAFLFNEKITLFKILERPTLLHFIFNHKLLKPKYEKANEKLKCFHSFDDSPSLINPLYFGADLSHPETIALQKKYQKEREEITESYSKENFLEVTLKRLTQSYSSKSN